MKKEVEEFLDRARDLFCENKYSLIVKIIEEYTKEDVEEILQESKKLFKEKGYRLIEEIVDKCGKENREEFLEELRWLLTNRVLNLITRIFNWHMELRFIGRTIGNYFISFTSAFLYLRTLLIT